MTKHTDISAIPLPDDIREYMQALQEVRDGFPKEIKANFLRGGSPGPTKLYLSDGRKLYDVSATGINPSLIGPFVNRGEYTQQVYELLNFKGGNMEYDAPACSQGRYLLLLQSGTSLENCAKSQKSFEELGFKSGVLKRDGYHFIALDTKAPEFEAAFGSFINQCRQRASTAGESIDFGKRSMTPRELSNARNAIQREVMDAIKEVILKAIDGLPDSIGGAIARAQLVAAGLTPFKGSGIYEQLNEYFGGVLEERNTDKPDSAGGHVDRILQAGGRRGGRRG